MKRLLILLASVPLVICGKPRAGGTGYRMPKSYTPRATRNYNPTGTGRNGRTSRMTNYEPQFPTSDYGSRKAVTPIWTDRTSGGNYYFWQDSSGRIGGTFVPGKKNGGGL